MKVRLNVREVLRLIRTYNELPIRSQEAYEAGAHGFVQKEPEWLHLKCTLGVAFSKCPKEDPNDRETVIERIVRLDKYETEAARKEARCLRHTATYRYSVELLRDLLAVEVATFDRDQFGDGSMTWYLRMLNRIAKERIKKDERSARKAALAGNVV